MAAIVSFSTGKNTVHFYFAVQISEEFSSNGKQTK
jgi:hypothetical protein